MLSKLCLLTDGTLLGFSRWAVTTVWDCLNVCSRTRSASLLIRSQYVKSAFANLVFPDTNIFRCVSLSSPQRIDWGVFANKESLLLDGEISAESWTDIDCQDGLTYIGTVMCTHDAAGFKYNGWWTNKREISDTIEDCKGTCSCGGVW